MLGNSKNSKISRRLSINNIIIIYCYIINLFRQVCNVSVCFAQSKMMFLTSYNLNVSTSLQTRIMFKVNNKDTRMTSINLACLPSVRDNM